MAVRSAGSDTVARTLSSGHAVLVLCSFFSLIFYLFCLLPGGSEHEPLEITPCLPVGAGCGRLVSLTYYVAHYPV